MKANITMSFYWISAAGHFFYCYRERERLLTAPCTLQAKFPFSFSHNGLSRGPHSAGAEWPALWLFCESFPHCNIQFISKQFRFVFLIITLFSIFGRLKGYSQSRHSLATRVYFIGLAWERFQCGQGWSISLLAPPLASSSHQHQCSLVPHVFR